MYRVAFISLGCAKNLVNTEQMMALCDAAGYQLQQEPDGADVVVINTCGFIDSAKEEAIDTILAVAQRKALGKVKKILVTGCLSQRYQEEMLEQLPEVDGLMGTGSYGEIVPAIREVMEGKQTCRFGSINAPVEELQRVLTTPRHFAYLRIAEGCDNHCAYCVIPSLRGRYRSRSMDSIMAEAKELADSGVRELIVIAQDITRYGTDLGGRHLLPQLLKKLCQLDFHWIRLHYLYPDEFDEELMDVIASEPKILKYLDIPIQHCNDQVLQAMNRRGNKQELLALFAALRQKMPEVVLRTSLITGLPYETEEAFEELCSFLQEVKLQRVGVFPYSPEEGTPAAQMGNRVDTDEAVRRAELIEQLQSRIIDEYNDSLQGEVLEVLCEGWDNEAMCYAGRSYGESPDIDGKIYFDADGELTPGQFVQVRITGAMDGELTGTAVEE